MEINKSLTSKWIYKLYLISLESFYIVIMWMLLCMGRILHWTFAGKIINFWLKIQFVWFLHNSLLTRMTHWETEVWNYISWLSLEKITWGHGDRYSYWPGSSHICEQVFPFYLIEMFLLSWILQANTVLLYLAKKTWVKTTFPNFSFSKKLCCTVLNMRIPSEY